MVRPDEITGYLDNQWFTSLAGMGTWLVNILASILVLAILYYLWVMLEHKIKVVVFPIYGVNPQDMDKIKSLDDIKGMPNVEIGIPKKAKGQNLVQYNQSIMDKLAQLGRPKYLRGKDFKKGGVKRFSLMKNPFKNPFKRIIIENIHFNYRYPDGIWMVNPAKDIYVPIQRPTIVDTVNLRVPDTGMDLWQQAEEAQIRLRTQDESTLKTQMYLTVAIIIGAFVIAGIIIWVSMSFAGNSINNVLDRIEPMTQALQNLVEARGPG